MKRTILTALVATAFAAPAYAGSFADAAALVTQPLTVKPTSGGIPHVGDETDLSWQYVAPTAKPQFQGSAPLAKAPVRIGDETDTSWEYQPTAKPQFDSNVANAGSFVEFADENDHAWLYQAPSAGVLADPQRQHPHVAYESSTNPIARVRQFFGKSQATGE